MNNDTLRIIFSYSFAFAVLIACFWFLYLAFLSLDTASLPEQQQNVIVAGIFGLLGSATTFVFSQAAASNAARQSERASAAGANAALSTPPGAALPTPQDTSDDQPKDVGDTRGSV